MLLLLLACGDDAADEPGADDIEATADDFPCIQDLTPVRNFFVDNLLGDLDATLDVAESDDGGVYPVGSLVQLVPFEAMVKRKEGWNPASRDWEYFVLTVDDDGNAVISDRGGDGVVNQLGGDCNACHSQADEQWDNICEQDHGCAPLGLDSATIAAFQALDARCD